MFCAYTSTRPRYQVSIYKTIGPLVYLFFYLNLLFCSVPRLKDAQIVSFALKTLLICNFVISLFVFVFLKRMSLTKPSNQCFVFVIVFFSLIKFDCFNDHVYDLVHYVGTNFIIPPANYVCGRDFIIPPANYVCGRVYCFHVVRPSVRPNESPNMCP